MSTRFKVFVGSSTEAEKYDRDIRICLEELGAEVNHWKEVFKAGDYTLEALLRTVREVDSALLIVTPDDKTWYRDIERFTPRDNILFELGIFIARLGKKNTGIVHVKTATGKQASIPTDLLGITVIKYEEGKSAKNEKLIRDWYEGITDHSDSKPWFSICYTEAAPKLSQVPISWRHHIASCVLHRHSNELIDASRGVIPLIPGKYYQLVHQEMDLAQPTTKVLAVASLSIERWIRNTRQLHYHDKNLAAAQRGANIRRLFVLSDGMSPAVKEKISQQIHSGITVRSVSNNVPELREIDDMVVFMDDNEVPQRAYFAYPDPENPTQIAEAQLVIDTMQIKKKQDLFAQVWDIAGEIA